MLAKMKKKEWKKIVNLKLTSWLSKTKNNTPFDDKLGYAWILCITVRKSLHYRVYCAVYCQTQNALKKQDSVIVNV